MIIYVLNALCGKKNKRTTTKITLLIVLSLWVHLVIGLFLAFFVLIKTWKNKPDKPFRSATFINTSIAILFFLLLYKWNSNPENSSMTAGRWIETALNNPFCQHYTNIFNLFDSKNSTRVLSALLTFFGSISVIHLISTLDKKPEENGIKSRETETLETIKYFPKTPKPQNPMKIDGQFNYNLISRNSLQNGKRYGKNRNGRQRRHARKYAQHLSREDTQEGSQQ